MSQGNPLSPSPVPRTDVFAEALRRARTADAAVTRPARRTFAKMAPGSVRHPVLHLAPNVHFLPTAVWDDLDADVCRCASAGRASAARARPPRSRPAPR